MSNDDFSLMVSYDQLVFKTNHCLKEKDKDDLDLSSEYLHDSLKGEKVMNNLKLRFQSHINLSKFFYLAIRCICLTFVILVNLFNKKN